MVGLPNFRCHSKSRPFATQPLLDHTKSTLGRISDLHCILALTEFEKKIFPSRQKIQKFDALSIPLNHLDPPSQILNFNFLPFRLFGLQRRLLERLSSSVRLGSWGRRESREVRALSHPSLPCARRRLLCPCPWPRTRRRPSCRQPENAETSIIQCINQRIITLLMSLPWLLARNYA